MSDTAEQCKEPTRASSKRHIDYAMIRAIDGDLKMENRQVRNGLGPKGDHKWIQWDVVGHDMEHNTCLVPHVQLADREVTKKEWMQAWRNVLAGFTTILGFLIALRAQRGYDRWWEGGTLLQQLRGEWFPRVGGLPRHEHGWSAFSALPLSQE